MRYVSYKETPSAEGDWVFHEGCVGISKLEDEEKLISELIDHCIGGIENFTREEFEFGKDGIAIIG